ncbi:TRAP-type C4-dicarboxylate transport system, substrate-binding protein [Marinobacter zhejiangensis]|uniref:TRAP-type C4-dicarboxylate transport system, substrate-binding protein n=2 Tax=Marinobacter zhejiangensis TaxID=488535 RepID=A0A1I4LDL0_9GAMM|nr:TRAP-type C4-dicarboxylate transport system, substrate-binding protein [Marinobacter zhejiangensis]
MKSRNPFRKVAAASALLASLALPAMAQSTQEPIERSFCVFDPVGANGPLFAITKTFQPVALREGIKLNLRAYTDEKVAAEDFKAGQCDAVLLTGTRAREFNRFTGSLEAMGAVPGEEEMRLLYNTLAQPNARQFLIEGDYEVAGVFPGGAVYLHTRDRNIDTVEELQGQKIATLDFDEASLRMVRHVGASVVGSNSANFAGKFNNGSVDLAYAPAVAYTPLELYKGVSPNGGVFRYALAYMNFQVIIHRDRFPENAGQVVRDEAMRRIDEAYEIIAQAEAEIPEQVWMTPPAEDVAEYDKMLQEVRLSLLADGVYDERAIRLMRAIRCRVDGTRAECSS